MPKKVTKKNYRKLYRGGWGGNNTPMNNQPDPLPKKKKSKKKGEKGKKKKGNEEKQNQINYNLYGGGWGRPMARSIHYDASPKMEMKKNFMNKYFKKYFK